MYLSACVSNLSTPVGVPLLKEMAVKGGHGTAKEQTSRRWLALWALAKLGDNLKRLDSLSPDREATQMAALELEAAREGERGQWAAVSLAFLQDRRAGQPPTLGVDEVLVHCSTDRNPFLREIAVFAMNFWPGGEKVEEALVARLDDRGEGEELLAEFYVGAKHLDRQFLKEPGLGVRYNAAVALARRGSDRVPVALLGEMLDESRQKEIHRIRYYKDGREAADEASAAATVQTALQAVAELHRKNPRVNLTPLDTAIEKLKQSAHPGLRKEAERTAEVLTSTP
jgi:hypothetical protein